MKRKSKAEPLILSPCCFVCHGLCECKIAVYIRGVIRKPVPVFSENAGRSSVQIHNLIKFLDTRPCLKSESAFIKMMGISRSFSKELLAHHRIICLMDFDDASPKEKEDYLDKKMFGDRWFARFLIKLSKAGPKWTNLLDVLEYLNFDG